MSNSHQTVKCFIHSFSFLVVLVFGFLSILGSGGGGDTPDYTNNVDIPCSQYGISIEEPTSEQLYSVSIPSVTLSGGAPLAQKWLDCYPCSPIASDVLITWTNDLTGGIGTAYNWAGYVIVFPYPWPIYYHEWITTIPLVEGDNFILVKATEDSKEIGSNCITVKYIPDSEPPSIPTGVVATALSPSEIKITWNTSNDNATSDDASIYYKVYLEGNYLEQTANLYLTNSGLSPGTTYCYSVSAIDTAQNESQTEPNVCETTLDQAEPTKPSDLAVGLTTEGNIELTWYPSTDDVGVEGYKIYRNNLYLTSVATTNYIDMNVATNTKYCYKVSAYDQSGNESEKSNESCTDTSWYIFTIDNSYSNIGEDSAIAIDSNDSVHIGYLNGSQSDLKYATNKSGTWTTETVDSSGSVGDHTAISLDSNDVVHLVYWDIGEWVGGTFFWNFDLKYATNLGGIWTNVTVGNGGWYNSIAIDSQDFLHVSHGNYMDGGLSYATNRTGSWTSNVIAIPDIYTSISVDNTDKIHISSYLGYPEYSLIYTYNQSDVWISEPVDTNNVQGYSDIALDGNGNAYISYCDSLGRLSLATNISGTWQIEVLVDPDTYSSCSHTSLALDISGNTHISYISRGGYLTYATNRSGIWVKTSLAKIGSLSGNPAYPASIALDSEGKVHISYYSATSDLRYITNK